MVMKRCCGYCVLVCELLVNVHCYRSFDALAAVNHKQGDGLGINIHCDDVVFCLLLDVLEHLDIKTMSG